MAHACLLFFETGLRVQYSNEKQVNTFFHKHLKFGGISERARDYAIQRGKKSSPHFNNMFSSFYQPHLAIDN